MDELLANLETDVPATFGADSVMEPAFNIHSDFGASQTDDVLCAPDMTAHVLSNGTAVPFSLPVNSDEIDLLTGSEAQAGYHTLLPPTQLPTMQASSILREHTAATNCATATVSHASAPASSDANSQPLYIPSALHSTDGMQSQSEPSFVPYTEHPRTRLAPLAVAVISESWHSNRHPAEFVSVVRKRLPRAGRGAVLEGLSNRPDLDPGPADQNVFQADDASGDSFWRLPPSSEEAILDALFSLLVKGETVSTRLLSYLQYSLITGLVSQRIVLSSCLKWVQSTPSISTHVVESLIRLMASIIPHYRFSFTEVDLTTEIKAFLTMFLLIIKCTARWPSLSSDLAQVLNHDRLLVLIRACARRIPSYWSEMNAAVTALESPSETALRAEPSFSPRSAFSVTPELRVVIPRLRHGLRSGSRSLESIATSIGNLGVTTPIDSLPGAIQLAFAVILHVLGTDVASTLRDLWSRKEKARGDLPVLIALERAAEKPGSGDDGQSAAVKYTFKDKVEACEAVVQFLADKSSVVGASDTWKKLWGGTERIKRIIRDAIPQVKKEIKSETGALVVSMSVICCAAMCLGPALQICDPNDGEKWNESQQEVHSEIAEETTGELIAFAIESLEEAASCEHAPAWRLFGMWLLLLMSRAGGTLRASGCEHLRAVRVLRAWGGMPVGTPGFHETGRRNHASVGERGELHANNEMRKRSSMNEVVATFAASSMLAIVDSSDVSGSDETIMALCDDLVH